MNDSGASRDVDEPKSNLSAEDATIYQRGKLREVVRLYQEAIDLEQVRSIFVAIEFLLSLRLFVALNAMQLYT